MTDAADQKAAEARLEELMERLAEPSVGVKIQDKAQLYCDLRTVAAALREKDELLCAAEDGRAEMEEERDDLRDRLRVAEEALERALPQATGCWITHYGENPEGGPEPEYIGQMREALRTIRGKGGDDA